MVEVFVNVKACKTIRDPTLDIDQSHTCFPGNLLMRNLKQ